MTPSYAVVVLTRDRRDVLLTTLRTAYALDPPPAQVIVVDNASSDGTQVSVARAFPQAEVLRMPTNGGYAAVNEGLRLTGHPFVMVLADDIRPAPDAARLLIQAIEAEGADAASGLLLETEPAGTVDSAGGHLTRTLRLRIRRSLPPVASGPEAVDYLPGGFFLARRILFEEIGLFDPLYHYSHDDLDLWVRAQAAGRRLVFVPQARAHHHSHAKAQTRFHRFHDQRAHWIFYARHAPAWLLPAFVGWQLAVDAPRRLVRSSSGGDVADVVRANAWGLARFPRLLARRARGRWVVERLSPLDGHKGERLRLAPEERKP